MIKSSQGAAGTEIGREARARRAGSITPAAVPAEQKAAGRAAAAAVTLDARRRRRGTSCATNRPRGQAPRRSRSRRAARRTISTRSTPRSTRSISSCRAECRRAKPPRNPSGPLGQSDGAADPRSPGRDAVARQRRRRAIRSSRSMTTGSAAPRARRAPTRAPAAARSPRTCALRSCRPARRRRRRRHQVRCSKSTTSGSPRTTRRAPRSGSSNRSSSRRRWASTTSSSPVGHTVGAPAPASDLGFRFRPRRISSPCLPERLRPHLRHRHAPQTLQAPCRIAPIDRCRRWRPSSHPKHAGAPQPTP